MHGSGQAGGGGGGYIETRRSPPFMPETSGERVNGGSIPIV